MSKRDCEDPMSQVKRARYDEVWQKWAKYTGIPWHDKRALGGCYEIVRLFYQTEYDVELYDFTSEKKYLFRPEYIQSESERLGGLTTVYEGKEGETFDTSILKFGDVMIMRLYLDPLRGGYSAQGDGRLWNHAGIYLGDDYFLHHPYQCDSSIEDLQAEGKWYVPHTELVLRVDCIYNK
ncbi:hypothetical protein SSZBM1_218 [Synechococcus phage S-SZBM1]|uniref:Uncharacterized protein n=1 Tax=Synechococcus phage S-SZBM1 TaxID=2926475 RepID=A0AC61TSW5_9CAUD|nr:hypothetical protein PP650_gp058 [Synechococcus phage S-SZBM1]UNH61335.1 hypothetical protein SSZBM1_218 [Synechococcus phage S-SZBM1]